MLNYYEDAYLIAIKYRAYNKCKRKLIVVLLLAAIGLVILDSENIYTCFDWL